MSHPHKRYADADATTESLLLITKKIDQQGIAIAELQGDVKELRGDVKELQGDVKELQGDVRELRGHVKELRGDVKELKGDVAALKTGQSVLMDNQLETNRALTAIMAHLGIAKPGA